MSQSIRTLYSVQPSEPAPALAGGSALGNTTKSLTPPSFALSGGPSAPVFQAKAELVYASDERTARAERYALQSVVRDLLPDSRTAHCSRSLSHGQSCVPVEYSARRSRASFKHLQLCASVWRCPVCSARISEQRRADLVRLVEAHKSAGGFVYLVTRTFPHSEHDDLPDLLACLKRAEDKYRQGSPWVRIRDRFGIIGTVRAVEATYGTNGWHPHIHELVLTDAPLDLDEFRRALYARWLSVCQRAGLGTPSEAHGLDVRDGTHAARYASKWGLESELTKWHAKRGAGVSLTPFDLLRVVLQSSDERAVRQARALYRAYAEAFHGKRQLVYSPGLLDRYGIDALTDEDAAALADDDAVLLGVLSLAGWRLVLRKDQRAQVLDAASTGSWAAVLDLLDGLRGSTPLADLTVSMSPPDDDCPF